MVNDPYRPKVNRDSLRGIPCAEPFARIIDTEPRNSVWREAATQLCRVSKETVELVRAQGEPEILEIACAAAARGRTDCPVEAEAVGF